MRLWTAISHIQCTEPELMNVVVYTGDVDATGGQIISKVKVRPRIDPHSENLGKSLVIPGSTSNALQNRYTPYS